MKPTTKTLVIAYFFPPDSTGVRRLLSHLEYWPELGIEAIVLTCKKKRGAGYDAAPLKTETLKRLKIVKTESWDPYRLTARFIPTLGTRGDRLPKEQSNTPAKSQTGGIGAKILEYLRRRFFLPDDRAGWIRFAVAEGERLIQKHNITAVYTSNYPQSTHVIGLQLKQRTGVRWIADFRDGWTQNPAFFKPENQHLAQAQYKLEREVAKTADEVITVSPPITRHLQSLRSSNRSPAITIFNGYDPGDFPPIEAKPFHPGCLTILYTGTFFGQRSPQEFFVLLAAVRRRSHHWRSALKVRFRCALSPEDYAKAKQLKLLEKENPCLELLPTIPFAECCREQQRAEALLLILERGPGAEIMVSQKVFEYLGAGRPIFALVPEGAAAEVLRQTGGACVQTSTKIGVVLKAFQEFLTQVEAWQFPLPCPEDLKPFHRREQALAVGNLLLQQPPKSRT